MHIEESEKSYEKELLAFIASQKQLKEESNKKKSFSTSAKNGAKFNSLNLSSFDPNSITLEELMEMGIHKNIAQNLINYREKVKPYNKPEDLKNLYTVNDYLFGRLAPFVKIQSMERKKSSDLRKSASLPNETLSEELSIDINSADTSDLKKIKGIGSYYAERISKFRDALGGFNNKDQYLEIYGLNKRAEAIEALRLSTVIPDGTWDQIDINTISAKELAQHPYFDRKLAEVLTNYAQHNGPIQDRKDLMGCHLVSDEIYLKIAPYIRID
ncbi:MAG: helix-hairpin-helix domain-containing protein [Bacteroidota bacterium]